MWDETRRKGNPRSEGEREERHEREHPGTPLPPRGTGLTNGTEGTPPWAVALGLALVMGLALAVIKKR